MGIWVRVIEQVDGVTLRGFPSKEFDQSITLNMDDGLIVRDPTDGILQQAQKIAVTGEPKGSFYVSWK